MTSPRRALIGVQGGRRRRCDAEPGLRPRESGPAARDGHGAGRRCPAAPGAGSGAQAMARGPGPLGRPRPDPAAMPKRGKRLKFRAHDACSGRGERAAGRGEAGLGAGEAAGRRGTPRAAGRPAEGHACCSDRGGLCQLGPGRREVRTSQESRGQCCSAGR